MPSVKHESLHRLLDEAIFLDSVSLGLRDEFVTVGAASYSELEAKRKPNSFRGENSFPTFVIESEKTLEWERWLHVDADALAV